MRYLVLAIVALLTFYAPCELTRLIIERLPIEAIKSNYTILELGQGVYGYTPIEVGRSIVYPWNLYVEIAFIWVGYITALVLVWSLIRKVRKVEL